MKRIFLVLAFMLSSGLLAHAQLFTLGIKGGISSSSVDVKDPKGSLGQFKEDDNITGFHAGAFARVTVAGFLVQPELLLSSSGGKIETTDLNGDTSVEELGFTNLDVPIMIGYKVSILRAYAGPVASVLINSDFGKEKLDKYFDTADWGYQLGAGVDISKLTLDVRYERLKRSYKSDDGSLDFRNQQIMLSLGYKILGK